MRSFTVCLLVVGLGAAVGVEKIHSRTHVANRGMQQALSHSELHDPNPCAPGYIKVFNPQLTCHQVQPAKDLDGLIVVTEETCLEVINGIKTKTAPYWDTEEQRCAPESRVELLTQCAQKTANFSEALQSLCHFETKVLNEDFHKVKIVPAIPAVEIPTGAATPGKNASKATQLSESMEAALNAHADAKPKTPDAPIEKYAEYPTVLTRSAVKQALAAQDASDHQAKTNGAVIKSFHYSNQEKLQDGGDSAIVPSSAAGASHVRSASNGQAVPATPIVPSANATGTPSKPNEEYARYPGPPSSFAAAQAVSAQKSQGILPSPTVISISHGN